MTNEEQIFQLHPSIQNKARFFLTKAKDLGFDLRITDGYRSPEQQQKLYNQGRTTPGKIVTNAKGLPVPESNHCWGLAIDVVDRKKGYDIDWAKLGSLGKQCGLDWGGDWPKFPDRPHFQFTGGLTLYQLQKGERPRVDTPTPPANNDAMACTAEELANEGFKVAFKTLRNTAPEQSYIDEWKASGKTASSFVREKYYVPTIKELEDKIDRYGKEIEDLRKQIGDGSAVEQLKNKIRSVLED